MMGLRQVFMMGSRDRNRIEYANDSIRLVPADSNRFRIEFFRFRIESNRILI
jgi:hypothetical protein